MASLLEVLIKFFLVITCIDAAGYNVFCPETSEENPYPFPYEDKTNMEHYAYNKHQPHSNYGLNVYTRQAHEDDCYLRYSPILAFKRGKVSDFFDPKADTVVFTHGWQSESTGTHIHSDTWRGIMGGDPTVDPDTNSKNFGTWEWYSSTTEPEDSTPHEHDAQHWIKEGWNVIFTDWRYYATEVLWSAEDQMYDKGATSAGTVVDAIYKLLKEMLDEFKWDPAGNELRLVGHSLGGQFTLNLAAKIKEDNLFGRDEGEESFEKYRKSLQRIALLDPFFSNGPKKDLGIKPRTDQYWTPGAWALEYNMKILEAADVVIENYKTSDLVRLFGEVSDYMDKLNARTVFVEMTPNYYGSWDYTSRHNVAFANYLHAMKFNSVKDARSLRSTAGYAFLRGENRPIKYNDLIPSCTMSTETLKDLKFAHFCQIAEKKNSKSGNAAKTTWDYDDVYERVDSMGASARFGFSEYYDAYDDDYDDDDYEDEYDNEEYYYYQNSLWQRLMNAFGYWSY